MSELLSESLQTAVATQQEYQLPSIFEVFAQEDLRCSIRPAFEHLVKVLANNNPERLGWLSVWYDEIFTLAELLVQHHFLTAHIASYSEMYYGLRRKIKGLAIQSHTQLDSKRHWWSLFALCIFPYFEVKMKNAYERTMERQEQTGNDSNLTLFGKIFIWLYPAAATLWQCWRLYLLFKYTIQQNKYPDPFFKLLKIKLVIEDPKAAIHASNAFSRVLTRMISGGVHAGVFLLQFIEWWYADANHGTVQKITQSPIPPPPPTVDEAKSKYDQATCPICKRRRTNDTALTTSGYVFCYVCVYKYVSKNQECPVTRLPTKVDHLIKLYPPE